MEGGGGDGGGRGGGASVGRVWVVCADCGLIRRAGGGGVVKEK